MTAEVGHLRAVGLDDRRWRDFAAGHPEALPYHHPAWARAMAETYGFEPFALVMEAGGERLQAGVPIVPLGGRLRPKRWVALPFTDFLPVLRTAEVNAADLAGLVSAAADEAGIRTTEIRALLPSPRGHERVRGVTHALELSDADTAYARFQPSVRRNIRKAEKSGLTIRVADDARDLTHTYFAIHADTRRRLGVPTQPRRMFGALWRNMLEPGFGFALLAYHGRQPVAGAVFLEWNGRVLYKFGASTQRAWPLRPNNLIFWTAIRRSCERGARELDFGRSDLPDDGLRAFKAGWGGVERPLIYTTLGGKPDAGGERIVRLVRPVLRHTPTWIGRGVGEVFYRFAA
jgi:CelD/BcsL family acetyltransferase involved in cellulose biosynthesis